jgi:hypothetical protein
MKHFLTLAILVGFSVLSQSPAAKGADPTPGYNTPIPPEITTPDLVDTKYLGRLEFSDGPPSRDTADKIYDHLA